LTNSGSDDPYYELRTSLCTVSAKYTFVPIDNGLAFLSLGFVGLRMVQMEGSLNAGLHTCPATHATV
jgi:hypothetical protein